MFTTQDKFLAFVRHLESANEEELDQALTLIQEEPKIATMFADKSPKFVEIFSHLQQGNVQTRIAVRYYRIISVLFDILTPNYQIYFRSLNYLSDTIIRRHMASMLILMKNKKGKDALHLLYQAAKVNTAHCRDLFTAIDFSNYIIKEQAKTDARPQLIQLISLFLQTPEISPSLLSTKYSVSGIWKDLIKDPNDVARLFLDSMIVATAKLNYSTKRWVFNDMTLKTLSSYPLDHRKSSVSPHFSAFQLLKSVLTGENSINTEEPQRVYCRNYQSIEPPPKNNFILFFIRELNPWRLMSHCELVISIFEDSPDLIGTYLSTCGKKLQPDVNLTTLSSIRFLGKIIELDWPAFLSNETNFFDDGHSLDLLFESILPSMIQTSVIIQFLKHESLIVRRGMLLLLNKAVNKFLKLPEALKRSSLYTKFGGRLTTTISQNIINTSKFESLFPFALKFFISMNQVFPFFVSDTFSKDPPFLNEIQSFPPYIQHLILQFIPLLSKPIPKIPLLCSIVTDDRFSKPIQRESLEIVKLIIRNTEIMNGFESEIPIFVSEALQNNASNNLFELINLTKGSLLKYSQHVGFSPMYNALQPENPLYNSKLIIDVMNGNVPNDIILEPSEIMKNIKWYSLEAITILLCASLHNNLQIGINCLTIVTCSSPERTLPYAQQHIEIDTPFFRFLLQFAHFLLTNAEIPIEIMLERGVLSVLFHALSSKDDHTRAISYHSLSQLYDYNHKKKGWKFENQIAILLESVLNAVTEPNKRFTSIITHFLSAATTIIMKPNHPLFMPVVKFIASNPSLKRSSVPMFNELFGQSTLDYRVGRMWILKFLRNGINESSDVLLMKKGRIIERLCSFFSSSLSDSTTRSNVLEIFINASKQIKIDGLIFWVYSIITEQFALMHYNQLIELALLTKQKTEIEKECLKRLIDIVMKEHPELIEEETLAKLKNLIGSETLNIE
ncbi:nucleolar pre-ribosomal-associated protein 1-like [Histomonas meleagridis]|uniref:nucleolar pre-ribosomal-associated protein 1-like n=1 Tax=Histomonas meleagridis TaxID=135588 RepID=UPI00355AB5FA|nr:nucleolar pre-ribosomal-associated protein 1-like [Histomonas meleagridis]KAH0797204.1 nucleolar pre-ribosomal-associated protein 1-like [Histomonas meleagridis]